MDAPLPVMHLQKPRPTSYVSCLKSPQDRGSSLHTQPSQSHFWGEPAHCSDGTDLGEVMVTLDFNLGFPPPPVGCHGQATSPL